MVWEPQYNHKYCYKWTREAENGGERDGGMRTRLVIFEEGRRGCESRRVGSL